jgi:plastocyanin
MLFESRAEIFGWVIAIIIVAIMGFIAFTGPYHKVVKAAAPQRYSSLHVAILTDPKTIGKYTPKTITVHLGQKVVFTNNSNADHTVTAYSNAFNSGNIALGASWTFIATKPGVYKYYCLYHPFMLGILTVK